ncbi:hypothetical protein DFH28DRAFT_1181288 [Melampsora americana]|nr:hypothetical protein DFH28DRAFT_1181288 [Melampsora americana]
MTHQKKIKPQKLENLKRKPLNALDARCLALKRVARNHAQNTVGQSVAKAAELHDQAILGLPSGSENMGDPIDIPGANGIQPDDVANDNSEVEVDMTTPSTPHTTEFVAEAYAHGLNSGFYAGRRQQEEQQWRNRFPAMFPVFLACQEKTSNWSDDATHVKDWKEPCNCSGSLRTFDVLDLMYRKQIQLKMCACSPNDQVRLIQAGYIGGTPVRPESVITIRLLRFFHIVWKHCTLRFLPFAEALNEFLDAGNPLFLTRDGNNIREWHRTLSSAIDAYRYMVVMSEDASSRSLNLTIKDELAGICPQCFGPGVSKLPLGEPDHIICMDGNFQHRRHLAASIENGGIISPSLFLPPEDVESLRQELSRTPRHGQGKVPWHDAEVDSCTARHTAADDVRGKSHWKGCDETGLMGMGCRHDQCLKFISIIQSGEKNIYPLALLNWLLRATEVKEEGGEVHGSLALLYDIGCTLQKGIVKRNQFPEARAKDRLKFATSLFHSFVHEWSCQLDYNPRLNDGWGLSDGEGMERIWSDFEPLVRPLRYSTKQHRLTALNFRAMHRNERGRVKSAARALQHLRQTQKIMSEARGTLKFLHRSHGHTEEYFKQQWERKKVIQSQTISQTSADYLEHVGELVNLEEKLVEAQDQLETLEKKKRSRRRRHGQRKKETSGLPNTLVLLEKAIERVTEKLGNVELCELTGTSDDRAKPLVKICVAKGKLLGAKVDVIEHRRRAGNARGTNVQKKMNHLRTLKNTQLKRKHAMYTRLAQAYNEQFAPLTLLATPSLQEVEAMDLSHTFLNFGGLIHSDEPWAVDVPTQQGIEAYISICRCTEELWRIAKEARQMMNWAVQYQGKIDRLRQDTDNSLSIVFLYMRSMVMINPQLTFSADIIPLWGTKEVISALISNLSQQACGIWLSWNRKIITLLHESEPYNVCETGPDEELQDKWRSMIRLSLLEREKMLRASTIVGQEEEIVEDGGNLGGEVDGDDDGLEDDVDEFYE